MHSNSFLKPASRRAMLRDSATLAGSAFLAQLFPASLLRAAVPFPQQQSAPADPVAAFRAQMAANPIHPQTLAENLTLLSGPGGNVVVLNGADGKIVVDTFVLPAWPKLKESLDTIGEAPVKTVINTHWHFDHVDNNASLHAADKVLPLANDSTKIIPGHGPLGGKADLVKFRDMLVTVRDRVQKLKSSGKSAQEAVAAKPFADLEEAWGKGFFNGDVFVQILYTAL